ncbi:MAG TPA: TIR domain-containing protein, partial [Ktedonobacterales bacterium]|nr:TIR domain-containing protein [Ktedonobacterales bacterium]
MWGNGKIFVSHTHADNQRCEPLLAALDAWGVDYWFDTQQLDAGAQLSERLQRAIAEHDVFLRVCTGSTRASYWMTLEFNAFRGLQLEEQKQRGSGTNRRASINLILDGAYKAAAAPGDSQAERADALVDATVSPPAVWLAQLRAALGIAPQRARQGISRRAAIGLGTAAVVTAAATGTTIVLKSQSGPTVTHVPKPKKVPFAVPNAQTLDPRLLWYFRSGDSVPAVALGPQALYLNSNDGFYALSPADGSIIWTNPTVTGDSSKVPVLAGDTIYALGGLGKLTAMSATNGSGLWTVDTKNLLGFGGIAGTGQSIV